MNKKKMYSLWFVVPSFIIFSTFFLIPQLISVGYSFTVWNFDSVKFTGWDNYIMFFSERSLNTSIVNTLKYAFFTSISKVTIAFFIAIFLTSKIKTKNLLRSVVFFPNLVSPLAVGTTFAALMHPTKGLFNQVLELLGLSTVNWLGNIDIALYSIIATDVWRGLSVSVVIYIAGVQSIDRAYYEAAEMDGASIWQRIKYITLPMVRPAMNSIIILSLMSGLRTFELVWTMTEGGPGFATDVLASVIYKQYAAGFYGLSAAGNVILFILIASIAYPLQKFLLSREEA